MPSSPRLLGLFCSAHYFRWYQGTVYAENKYRDAQRLEIPEEALDSSPDADKIRKARLVTRQIQRIRVHRHFGQPYVSTPQSVETWTFLNCCVARVVGVRGLLAHPLHERLVGIPSQRLENRSVLLSLLDDCIVGLHLLSNLAADVLDEETKTYPPSERPTDPISNFLASYVPIVSHLPPLRSPSQSNPSYAKPFFLLLTFGYKLIYQTKMISLDEMDFSRINVDEDAQRDPDYRSPLARMMGWLLVN